MEKLSFLRKAIVITTLVSTWSHPSHGQTIAQMNALSATLFTGYNKHTRPVNDPTQNVTVTVNYITLLTLREFDEVLGKLSSAMGFYFIWTDESLVWDPSTNDNITNITVSQDAVWKPPIALANPYNDLDELGNRNWMTVTVESDGTVHWFPFSALDTTCSIETQYYPYDRQTCNLQMYPFGYNEDQVTLNIPRSYLGLEYYERHATWNIVSTNVANVQRGTPPQITTMLTITIQLERQPNFIIFTFLLPILVLSLLNPLVFFLPTDSGERISFSITILLALSVFMTILADYIPPNADPISMCAVLLMILYLCSSVIVLLVIISIKIYFISKTRPISPALRAFVRLCPFRCCNRAKVFAEDESIITPVQQIGSEKPPLEQEDTESSPDGTLDMGNEVIRWKDVCHAFDESCLVIVYIADILVMSIYLSILQSG